MRIAILSDTHIDRDLYKITNLTDRYFKDIDLILHAGDYKSDKVIDILKRQKRFVGVWGNNDGSLVKEKVKEKVILTVEGYKIGLFHGHGGNKNTLENAYEQFKDDKLDVLVFGHSHQPLIRTKGKTLILNPGSPTAKRKERWFSYIVLELEKHNINATLKLFSERQYK